MKRYTCILFLLLFAFEANSQIKYPYAVGGPEGIYVMCGNKIPRDFTYTIFRSEMGKNNWSMVKTQSFSNNFDEFYRDLAASGSKNNIFSLPKEKNKGVIWRFIQQTNDVDSIPFFGTIPIYREALGVAFYDQTAIANTSYIYKIQKSGSGIKPIDALTETVKFPAAAIDYKIRSLSQSAMENRINLRYYIGKQNKLYSVRIFRQNYLQSDFIEVPAIAGLSFHKDSLEAWAIDTLTQKKAIYKYFALPYDLYGNPGKPSDTIKIINLMYKPESIIMALHTSSLEKDNAISISWKCEIPDFLRSIDVFRSTEYDNGYLRIGSAGPRDTAFIDTGVNPITTYYYYLVINNAYGQSERSARISGMLEANREASVPTDLRAKTETGKVILSWRKPSGDTRGYYVFRSDDGGETFNQLSNLIITDALEISFTDSLMNVNNTNLAYGVKSENISYRISPMTGPVFVNPILLIPLVTPVNLIAKYTQEGVLLTWDDASLLDGSVRGYNLYRKILSKKVGDSTEFKLLDDNLYSHFLNYCIDKSAAEGENYAYAVESMGVNSTHSSLSIPALIKVPVFNPVSLAGIYAKRTDTGNYIEWQKTLQENILQYKVYRLIDNAKPLFLKTLSSENTSYTDTEVPAGKSCFYAVTCVNNKNIESAIDEWVKAE